MGIKDKVLDILFDDDGEQDNSVQKSSSNENKKNYKAASFLDTGSIFIDATSPLPKTKTNQSVAEENDHYDNKTTSESGYQMSENISPIFGVIDSKNKKSKNISKVKSYNDISNKKFESSNKNQASAYTSVVISPIYGPISTKPIKKNTKPRKKIADPFERDLSDTGNFDAIIEDDTNAPEFTDAKEEYVEITDTVGDTDRLVRISDKINRIKNEAANIYNDDDSNSSDMINEDVHKSETIEHENISDVIHSIQNYDGKVEHKQPVDDNQNDVLIDQNDDIQPVSIESDEPLDYDQNDVSVSNYSENDFDNEDNLNDIDSTPEINTFEENEPKDNKLEQSMDSNVQTSVDDIFDEEDESEEGKDLFNVLFGDD